MHRLMVEARLMRLARLALLLMGFGAVALACNLTGPSPATPTAPPATLTVPPTEPPTVPPTPSPNVTATPTPTSGPSPVVAALPSEATHTSTPATPTVSPIPTASLTGKVCPSCAGLRVRQSPGTAGKLLETLPANTSVTVIGRTTDSQWYLVVAPDGQTGWGYADFVVLSGDSNLLTISSLTIADLPTSTAGPPQPTFAAAPDAGPVVTGITSQSRKIFLYGQTRGNLAEAFTRVGDSITAAPQFLHQFAGPHDLGQYGYLEPAVSWFSGPNARGANPFQAASIAEHNNWTTFDVLDAGQAPTGICQPGETPLICEYRISRPSVALILIGTNDAARDVSPAQFQGNLQTIVSASISMGVIPVLSTLPPKHLDSWNNSRVDQFNGIIVTVARSNDIPLWNLWLALQNVPNQGISPDGVHLDAPPDGLNVNFDPNHLTYGYPVRNLTALQVLDALRRQVLYGGATPVGGGLAAGGGNPAGVAPAMPTANPCIGAPLPTLRVGGNGFVTPGLPNKLRAGPHLTDTIIGAMPGGATFSVIGGPVCTGGLRWWQITYNGLNAWTADGQGTEYWLQPAG